MSGVAGNHMNAKKLFVGNLTYSVRADQLRVLFSRFGEVISANIVEKKGYGFVEMATEEQADRARCALSETEFEGRNLLIDGVRPPMKSRKKSGPPRGAGKPPARPPSKPGQGGYGYRGKKPTPPPRGGGRSGRPGQSSRPGSSRPPARHSGGSRR